MQGDIVVDLSCVGGAVQPNYSRTKSFFCRQQTAGIQEDNWMTVSVLSEIQSGVHRDENSLVGATYKVATTGTQAGSIVTYMFEDFIHPLFYQSWRQQWLHSQKTEVRVWYQV